MHCWLIYVSSNVIKEGGYLSLVNCDHLTLVKLWHQELAIFSFSMLVATLLKI
jgi:hypothetical protein